MGTRGSVAWLDKKGEFVGVYNHWDSYPTGLGHEVLTQVRDLGIDKVVKGLKIYGDWREYKAEGVCKYCGVVTGQAHTISGIALYGDLPTRTGLGYNDPTFALAIKNIKETGFPDPDATAHLHSDSHESQFDPRTDPLFMEWFYLLDEKLKAVHVYTNHEVPRGHVGAIELEHSPGTYYGHIYVGKVYTQDLMNKTDDDIAKLCSTLEDEGNKKAEAMGKRLERIKAKGGKP